MSYDKIDSIVGLHVEKVEHSSHAPIWSLKLHLSYGTTLTIAAGGEDAFLSPKIDGTPSLSTAVGKEISFVDYDDDLCSSIMHLTFTDGTELEVRSTSQGVSWVEANISH
jgi:hypothetical protein